MKKHPLDIPKNLKREHAEVKGDTNQVQIKVTDNSKKVIGAIHRAFAKIEDAKTYLTELMKDGIKDFTTSKDGEVTTCGKLDIATNYDVRLILKGKAPKKLLPRLAGASKPAPEFKKSESTAGKDVPSRPATSTDAAPSKRAATGKVVVLKQICQELKLEPRKARSMLRSAAKAKKVPREADGGRWQWSPEDAETVKILLRGK